MKVVENYVDRYIKRYHTKIRQLCEPLERCFGINYFTYHSLTADGLWSPIVNRVDFAEFYTNSQLYLKDPFLMHPRFYQSGTLLWMQCLQKSKYQEVLQKAENQFDIAHGFIFLEQTEEGFEFFGFSAPKDHPTIYSTYNSHQAHLRRFCAYFKEELSTVLKQVHANPIDLLSLKGNDFSNEQLFPDLYKDLEGSLFLKYIKSRSKINLTKREKETLSLYLDEMSMVDVADRMQLSPRTVESYLGSIKCKLYCRNKTDLLKIGQQLRSLAQIP